MDDEARDEPLTGDSGWLQALGLVVVVATSLLSGVAAVALVMATDDSAPADYDAGNRFAIGAGIVTIPILVAPVALTVYGLLIGTGRSWWVATAWALVPTLCAVVLVNRKS